MKYPLKPVSQTEETSDLLERFRKQADKVEQLMNASMRPLMRQESLLSDEARRQALETLERWSELYRHGLKASGMIAERGEEWLREAYQRLSLTADELRKLDASAEALATQKRGETSRRLQEAIDKIKNLVMPMAEQVKSPVVDSAISVA
jgi:seryl-tRNA(Sec) selenium transferase